MYILKYAVYRKGTNGENVSKKEHSNAEKKSHEILTCFDLTEAYINC